MAISTHPPAEHLEDTAAAYARPIFLRLSPTIEVTGTFKQRKIDLVREGFDPENDCRSGLWLDPEPARYVSGGEAT